MTVEEIIEHIAKKMKITLKKEHLTLIKFEMDKYRDFFKDVLIEGKEPVIKEFFTGKNKQGEKVLGILFENPYKQVQILDEKSGEEISIDQIPMAKIFEYVALIINLENPEKTGLNILNMETIIDLKSYPAEDIIIET